MGRANSQEIEDYIMLGAQLYFETPKPIFITLITSLSLFDFAKIETALDLCANTW